MDINKQKLKNRLNVKFQPFKAHPTSLKRLQLPQKLPKDLPRQRQKDLSVYETGRNRSTTNVRLPSLQKKPLVAKLLEQKTEEIISLREMKQRIKSIKVMPIVKVQSKQSINQTITYLIKNQVLNIPKIVAMLQKSQSDQFLYMKVKGIYEYEVCSEAEKGNSYITVSKNGMVSEGQLIPLQLLIKDYEVYTKLKKIEFFKYFLIIKFMNKWNRGSKLAKMIENKYKVKKLLNLQSDKIILQKLQLKNIIVISDKGGSINSGWVNRVAKQVEQNKEKVQKKLLQFSSKLLQKFELPIGPNFQLMNKVLLNTVNLNLSFEKKLRIQKELQIVYKMGRMLEMHQQQSIAFYVIDHIQGLIVKFLERNEIYKTNILEPIEALDMQKPNYVTEKQQILRNNTTKEEINFKMLINDSDQIVIQPSMSSILASLKSNIKEFIAKIDKFDFRIIRVPNFNYIVKNVIKPHDYDEVISRKESTLKQYIYSINAYFQKLEELNQATQMIDQTIKRKNTLVRPFFDVYLKYRERLEDKLFSSYNYDQIYAELQQIQEKIQFCRNKLHDGQYFILGYLSQLQVKEQIINFLNQYKSIIISIVPNKTKGNRQRFYQNIFKHLSILRTVIKTPDDFINVYTQCQELEQKIVSYVSDLSEIQRLQDLYLRVKKVELGSLVEQKNLLNELKIKTKNYKQTKQSSFLIYRKEVDNQRELILSQVGLINPAEQYYEVTKYSSQIYNKCNKIYQQLEQINKQLVHLNQLEAFFNLKQTFINRLDLLTAKFQNLTEFWLIYKEYDQEFQAVSKLVLTKYQPTALLKKYQAYIRKVEKYNKDPDFYKISEHLLERIPPFLSTLYLVQDLHNSILRPKDFSQIGGLFQKQFKLGNLVNQITIGSAIDKKLYSVRPQILQINFKSHKQQEIQRLLAQFDNWWKTIRLEGEYLDEFPLIIIFNDNDHVRQQIEEQTTILMNIINHKYGTFARKECNKHLRNINSLAQLLGAAIQHQDKFLNLFPILTSKYAQKQLPSQSKRFMNIIQKNMKNVKWLIKPTQHLNQNARNLLSKNIKQFDSLSKSLSMFLQKKRVKFQRFYFLQDDELLEVLVGIGAENTIFRMFQGVKGWLKDEQDIKIGVIGVGNERLKLRGWSYKTQQPQVVFKSLQQSIRLNLNSMVRQILHSYENQLKDLQTLYQKIPWMCVYTLQLILFTKQVEINCFQNGVKMDMQSTLIHQNIAVAVASPFQNANYITLELFLLHFVQELKHEDVHSVFDFKWNSFLRYYYEKEAVVMRALGSEHAWGGQYQGLWNLMINTSDIRRAHTSILSNLKYGSGVLLQGPSGTGKTQSLKQLGRCMAKYCVIFNCSSQVNIKTLQKLLSGLCYTGSWLCLDQINRLSAQIMSVVATQIHTIKNAILQNKESFQFMGKYMRLRHGVGIFSTMNPIYLKRARLTESLKSYFRIISVNVPDYQKILQVMIYSSGIAASSKYSQLISKLFKNLSIQLSQRPQYDFGMRAMKFFIYNLSQVRKTVKNEEQSIIQALYKTFYSRLDSNDKQAFKKVLTDTLVKKREQSQSNFNITMMKEAPQTGIIVLGPTSCKTTTINDYIELFDPKKVTVQVFNPNSIDLRYFLGENNHGKWQQGIVQKLARDSFQNHQRYFILVLDSKLKSQTIQNFNTLLDDSKLLSLSNGTRLKIQNNFKIIMETPDLQMTSPATITRCNVVYVCEQSVKKSQIIDKLVPKLGIKEIHDKVIQILTLFSQSVILKIMKMAKLIFFRKIRDQQCLTESQSFGFQKSFMFALQILGYSQKAKQFLNRDNSISLKRSPFNYFINFSKYKEGQFAQFQSGLQVRYNIDNIYIPTVRDMFYNKMNARAIQRQESILWKGQRMSGKSIAILNSLEEIYNDNQQAKNMFKLTLNSRFSSRVLIDFLEEKSIFRQEQTLEEKDLLIYIDDINLANEEIKQVLRYTLQYKRMFSLKHKSILSMQKHIFIADATNQPERQYKSRFCRHFVQINLPLCEDSIVKNIFTTLIKSTINKTKCSEQFKNSYDLQLDRLVDFIICYIKTNNQAFSTAYYDGTLSKQKLQNISYGNLFKIIKNLSILNDQNCKQVSDFSVFLFSQLRNQQVQHKESVKQLDFLKIAFSQVFKQKYQKQYNSTLKSLTGHPSESIKFAKNQNGQIRKIENWQVLKNLLSSKIQEKFYVSQFILIEIIKILRVLDWNKGNYYLVGNEGIGKKTILKIASYLSGKELNSSLPIEQKKIQQWFFNMIKLSFEKRKEQIVMIQITDHTNEKILQFLEKINCEYPIQRLLNTQACDYAYNNAQYYDEITYKKFNKPYVQVINDFLILAKKNIQYLFCSVRDKVNSFVKQHHYLHKNTTYSFAEQFPSESILQISNKILQKNRPDIDNQKLNTILLKIYNELSSLMKNNMDKNLFHFKYNPFYHFSMIKCFLKNYNLLIEEAKMKEDILNRSILKVHQISQMLEKIKTQIKQIQPVVKQKTQKLLAVVPILEEKKRASQSVKAVVLSQKKQIQARNDQIEEMMKEVEQKIKRSQPIIQQANESMLTIKRGDLSELRNNPNPHPLIKFTLQNLVILIGQSQVWENIKKVLSDSNLLSRLKSVSPSILSIQKVQKRINENIQWTFDNVSKVSFGVRYMVKWITNILKFFQMKFILQKQKNKVQSYKAELNGLQQKLNHKQSQLNVKQREVKIIQDEYNSNKNQLISLQELVTSNNRKYDNAELIKEHLHQEINSWYDRLNLYKSFKKNAEANSILATLYLEVYITLHTQEQELIDLSIKQTFQRLALPYDASFKVQDYVKSLIAGNSLTNRKSGSEKENLLHKKINLESLSIEDSSNTKIIQTIYHLNNKPIILDPDNQALNWLRRQTASEDVIIVKQALKQAGKQTTSTSVVAVEQAMKEGHILVILTEEELDNFTKNVLNAKITQTAGSRVGEYNKNIINIDKGFRLILCNKSRNPNISSMLFINHPVLNFQITKKNLKLRLIKELIMLQNKQIYNIQKQLQIETKSNQKVILQFEKQIIESLINSKRNLIDDNQFINLLQQNQSVRVRLKENQIQCFQKSITIKRIVDNYQNITEEASKIYVSLKLMTKINPLLSWNSDIFVEYFVKAANNSITVALFDQDDQEDGEIQNPGLAGYDFNSYNIGLGNSRPTSALSYMSGITTSRGVPMLLDDRKDDFDQLQLSGSSPPKHNKKDHSTFQDLVGYKELEIDENQKGVMSRQREKKIKTALIQYLKPAFDEQQRIIWGLVLCLIDIEFKDIKFLFQAKTKRKNLKQYLQSGQLTERIKNYMQKTERVQEQLTKIFSSKNPFHKLSQQLSQIQILLLGKITIPNNFSQLCQSLIRDKGYQQILKYSQTSTANWFQRSDNIHPILLVMGQDPIYKISDYLARKKYRNVILIPMGEGQNKLAQVVFQKEIRKENLVIIHNLHISSNFMVYLSRMLQQFQIKPPDKKFRLILISNQFQGLNQEITSYCHKYQIQQPMGLKNQIKYLRQQNTISLVHPQHRKLSFVIAYLHSIINNLSKFKPYGWNLKYQFHTTDFINAIQTLKQIGENYLNLEKYECNIDLQQEKSNLKMDQIDFKALRYMIGQIGYVGKLADDIDRAKMNLLIQNFIQAEILRPSHQSELIKSIKFTNVESNHINKIIQEIPEQDSTIFGLHPHIKPVSQNEQLILSQLSLAYDEKYWDEVRNNQIYDKHIEPINHKFDYINQQIKRYNQNLDKIKAGETSEILLKELGNGFLLSSYTSASKVFNLKAFSNPRQFFIAIVKDVAHKNDVIYQKVELLWSLSPKQSALGLYGISNLKLEGACLNSHRTALDDGVEETDVTLFVQAVIKKKDKQAKKLISIPIYLNEERQGQINSYGDNTNLLARAKLQANNLQDFWILRSTAFVVQ